MPTSVTEVSFPEPPIIETPVTPTKTTQTDYRETVSKQSETEPVLRSTSSTQVTSVVTSTGAQAQTSTNTTSIQATTNTSNTASQIKSKTFDSSTQSPKTETISLGTQIKRVVKTTEASTQAKKFSPPKTNSFTQVEESSGYSSNKLVSNLGDNSMS